MPDPCRFEIRGRGEQIDVLYTSLEYVIWLPKYVTKKKKEKETTSLFRGGLCPRLALKTYSISSGLPAKSGTATAPVARQPRVYGTYCHTDWQYDGERLKVAADDHKPGLVQLKESASFTS